jgi:hypothetical protein
MYRSLISAAAALSLFVSTFVSPAVTYAKKRCPDEPPSTLLSLYRKSEAIFVGKFDKTTVGDVITEDEHSTMVNVSDHYSISSTLKGKTEKFFVHTYEQYSYKGEDGAEEIEEEEGYGTRPKPGDAVLLFLKLKTEEEAEEGKPARAPKRGKPELDVVHYRDAIRPVKVSEVSSYEARIKDLNGIFSSKKEASDADILKWILKCIDDPVTRWDGAFELLTSIQNLEWKKEQEKEREKETDKEDSTDAESDAEVEAGEKTEDSDEEADESHEMESDEEEFDNSAYASLLTTEQKDYLTNIAINLKPRKAAETAGAPESDDEKPTLDEGDRVLFELVKRWGDARLAAAMLDRLRASGEENYQKASWMTMIAEVLKDSELSSLGEKFSELSWREDADTVETEKNESESKKPETDEVETKEPVSEKDPVIDEISGEIHDGPPEKKTYKMLRDELLAQFIDRANVVITKESEVAKNKKAGK